MSVCPVVPLDLASPYATLLDAKSVGEITRRGCDWSLWLACHSAGVIIETATWTIHADDDDGSLSLSQEDFTAGVSSVLITGGTVRFSYRLVNTVTTDDGQTIIATVQVPVRDVFAQALAA